MNPQDLAAMAPDNLKLEVLLIIQFNTGSKGILGFKKKWVCVISYICNISQALAQT